MSDRVLVVEDDESLRAALTLVLRAGGFDVVHASDGHEALAAFDPTVVDAVVLDIMLPGIDGFEVCREIRRQATVPIIMVTARDQANDVVEGLESGADDYIVKPFEGPVLLARLRAVLRRARPDEEAVVQVGEIRLDFGAFRAWRETKELNLSAIEFRLLNELMRHAGQVLSREALLDRVWGYDYLGDSRLVDMAIKRLRDKIGGDGVSGDSIVSTVRGVGYRFERR